MLTVEARRLPKPWSDMSNGEKREWVEKFPRGKYARMYRAENGSPKAKTERKGGVKRRPKKQAEAPKPTAKKEAPVKTEKPTKKPKKTKKIEKKLRRSEKRAAKAEKALKVMKQEQEKRSALKVPAVRNGLDKSMATMADRSEQISRTIGNQMSPAAKASVGTALTKIDQGQKIAQELDGKFISVTINGAVGKAMAKAAAGSAKDKLGQVADKAKAIGQKVSDNLMAAWKVKDEDKAGVANMFNVGKTLAKGALVGAGLLAAGAVASSLVGVAGPLLLGAMFTNHAMKRGPMAAQASGDVDPMFRLTNDFNAWFKAQNADNLAKMFSDLQVSDELAREDYKPDEADMAMVSESSAAPRITIRVAPAQKALAPLLRTRFEVFFDNRVIGDMRSDPDISGNGKARRSWVCTLREGFNESAYRSGLNSDSPYEPYTAVTRHGIRLRNPMRLTFDEARSWIKTSLDRTYL